MANIRDCELRLLLFVSSATQMALTSSTSDFNNDHVIRTSQKNITTDARDEHGCYDTSKNTSQSSPFKQITCLSDLKAFSMMCAATMANSICRQRDTSPNPVPVTRRQRNGSVLDIFVGSKDFFVRRCATTASAIGLDEPSQPVHSGLPSRLSDDCCAAGWSAAPRFFR
jgi:hypothetical protein